MTEAPARTAKRSVLYYVAESYPVEQGYTVRTHSTAVALRALGHRISVANRLLGAGAASESGVREPLEIDDILYLRPPRELLGTGPEHWAARLASAGMRGAGRLRRSLAMRRYARWLAERTGPVDLVHLHTPPEVAAEGELIARRAGVPLLYEVRGFWRLSEAAESQPGQPVAIAQAVAADAAIARRADHVVPICRGIADRLVASGVPASKITVIPNGVDTKRFEPRERDEALAQELGLSNRIVFGYATNVRRMEGLHLLVEAWPDVLRSLPEAVFLLVGSGTELEELRRQISLRGLEDSFRLPGRIDRERIADYYALFDVFVVPRTAEPVCRLVTPLKPLEAMAMGIPVIASDVEALTELVTDGETGLLFRADDPKAAADACVRLGRDAKLRADLARQARRWVGAEREWSTLCRAYDTIYGRLLEGSR